MKFKRFLFFLIVAFVMPKPRKPIILDVEMRYPQIRDLIDKRQKLFGEFDYIGLTHRVVQGDKSVKQTPADFMFPNGNVDGVEITLWQNADLRFAKPIIFHEFVEWLARERFRKGEGPLSHAYQPGSRETAHKKATAYDLRFAREIFDDNLFKEYMDYKTSLEQARSSISL